MDQSRYSSWRKARSEYGYGWPGEDFWAKRRPFGQHPVSRVPAEEPGDDAARWVPDLLDQDSQSEGQAHGN